LSARDSRVPRPAAGFETEQTDEKGNALAMSRLTIQQAEVEAKWRWGGLFSRGFARHSETLKRPFQVGTIRFGSIRIRGQGTSWEGAFSDAARLTNTETGATTPMARASRTSANPVAGQITTARGPEGR
jgi:hypothetical protein